MSDVSTVDANVTVSPEGSYSVVNTNVSFGSSVNATITETSKVNATVTTGGVGDRGGDGNDGLSAYDVAVNNGFVGTEQEWLDSYKPDTSLFATKDELEGKVDTQVGKDLSTNDYTDEDKERLENTTGTNTGDQDLSDLAERTELEAQALAQSEALAALATAIDVETDALAGAIIALSENKATKQNVPQFHTPYRDQTGSGETNTSLQVAQNSAAANTVARRTPAGELFTADPSNAGHAIPRSFADGRYARSTDAVLGGSTTFGDSMSFSRASASAPIQSMPVLKTFNRAYILSLYAMSSEYDHLYQAHLNPQYTVSMSGATEGTVGGLFNGVRSDSMCKDPATLADTPLVITIECNIRIEYTDVISLVFTGHRLLNGGILTDYKIETKAVDGNWYTAVEKSGAADQINLFRTALHNAQNTYPEGLSYHGVHGVRITITGANTAGGTGYANRISISGVSLINGRGGGRPAAGVGALDMAGGSVYGEVNHYALLHNRNEAAIGFRQTRGGSSRGIGVAGSGNMIVYNHNSAREQLNILDNGIIYGPAGSPGGIFGSGSPNGAVTAGVGTIYTDVTAWMGAMVWYKRAGTGNTGWEVIYGDTGWRNIPVEAGVTIGFLRVRRTHAGINFICSIPPQGNITVAALDKVTRAFLPDETHGVYPISDASELVQRGIITLHPARGIKANWSGSGNQFANVLIPCTQPWPTSLPGTP